MVKACVGNTICGWSSAKNLYTCGMTGGADPTGANPKDCPP